MAHHYLVVRQFGSPPGPPRPPEYLAEDYGPRLLAIEGSLFALSMSVILMRCYVRIYILKMFGWDDWMMVISATLSTICLVLFVDVIRLGLGRHIEAFPPQNFLPFFKVMYFYSIAIITAYSFIKLSIGFFLLRIADRTKWRPFLIGMLVFIAVFTMGSILAIIFQCIPVQAGYDFSLRPPTGTAKCYSSNIFKNIGVFNSSINIFTDLLFALIPIPMVWRLQITLRTRLGLAIILGLGFFASAVAIYKTPLQYTFFQQSDFSGHGAWYYIWQQVEMHMGILAACLPTLKPLFASCFTRLRTTFTFTTTHTLGSTRPHDTSGYIKQHDTSANTFAMHDMAISPRTCSDHLLGKDTYTVSTNGGQKNPRQRSRTGAGDERRREAEQRRSNGLARGLAIVRTTEVSVTR